MDIDLVKNILHNRREGKIMSKSKIEEEIKDNVLEIYREFIDFEENKNNLLESLEKLKNYKYCSKIEDINKGNYIRYINQKYFYNIKLCKGGFVKDIDLCNNFVMLINGNRHYKIKFSDKSFYIKMDKDELIKLDIVDLIDKN